VATKADPTTTTTQPAPRHSLWTRLTSWLSAPSLVAPAEMRDWLRAATALAQREQRTHVSLDDLFLSLGADEDLAAWLAALGTSLDDVVDDVRCALDAVDAKADRSGTIVVDGFRVTAVGLAAAHAWAQVQGDPEASRALALFLACLRPGAPCFARDAFEKRTGTTLVDLLWQRAHGGVVDVDAVSRRSCGVLYNDNYSTQELVVRVLRQHARLTPADAESLMLSVHRHGVAVVAEGLTAEMQGIKEAMLDDARRHGYPLRVRLEPVSDGLDP
jgi:ATP-dependent Clp protease adaptor protein ClpS